MHGGSGLCLLSDGLVQDMAGCVVRCPSSVTDVCSLLLKRGDFSLLGPSFPEVYYCFLDLLSCALLRTCFTWMLEEAII